MGFGLGGSYGSASSSGTSSASSSGASNTANIYNLSQLIGQENVGSVLQNILGSLPGAIAGSGEKSPQVKALETASAGDINKAFTATGDRMNRFLASRGFGASGTAGQAQLQTELGRSAALAKNSADYGGMQMQNDLAKLQTIYSPTLLSALNYAFNPMGASSTTYGTSTGTETGSSSGFKVGAGVSGGI